jgi:exosortase
MSVAGAFQGDPVEKVWPRAFWLPWAAAAALSVAYVPFFQALANAASRQPYAGHVVFVPIVAAVVLAAELPRWRGVSRRGHAAGAALAALALTLLGLGYRTGSLPLQAVSLAAAAAAFLLWSRGTRGVRTAGFVVPFLLLAIPPPGELLAAVGPPVQYFVATFSTVVLESLHIPVEQQGIFLHLPGQTLEVAEECNGLRFLLILVVLVSGFARLVLRTIPAQLLVIVAAIPVAVLANAIRVAATAVGAYAIGPHVATGPVHYYVGKGMWLLAILFMIGTTWVLRTRMERCVSGDAGCGDACAASPS